ncbi:MAG: AMP-binding protein [[Clostridium] scindens]
MDLYTCLACGSAVGDDKRGAGGLSEDVQAYGGLRRQGVGVYAIFCRCMPGGSEICTEIASIAPGILFAEEQLTNRTALQLQERFPKAVIVNTYGPTESTVALTEVKVDRELAVNENPLPVGRVKRGSAIEIWDEQGKAMPDGESGEIILMGDTVSTGYHQREELSRKSFFMCRRNDEVLRGITQEIPAI